MKFISWDHVLVVLATAIVMILFSRNSNVDIRMIDWVLMYGVILANFRAVKSST